MRILLTGATGFVGRCILETLSVNPNFEIDTVSRTKFNSKERQAKLSHYCVDLARDNINQLLRLKKYNILIHAAWLGLPSRNPEINSLNLQIASALFEQFASTGGEAIIGIGSCLEYGDSVGSITETDLGRNIGDFGLKKRSLALQLSKLDIPYLWLRPFYLFGPYQHKNSLFHLTINNSSSESYSWLKEPMAVNDFVSINDLGNLIMQLIQDKLWLGELNVGSGNPMLNIEFANTIRELLGKKPYEYSTQIDVGMSANLKKLREAVPNFRFTSLSSSLSASLELQSKVKF